MKMIYVAAVCGMLTSCISTAPTQTQLTANADMCQSFGYPIGSRPYADCQFTMAQQSAQRNEIAKARAHAFFRSLN